MNLLNVQCSLIKARIDLGKRRTCVYFEDEKIIGELVSRLNADGYKTMYRKNDMTNNQWIIYSYI